MSASQNFIQFEHVSFKRHERSVFSDLTLSVHQYQITAIMGPSGSGKTTILRLAGKQLLPNSGSITVFGQPLTAYKGNNLLQLRRRMGVLFQSGALFSELNVFDNVALPLHIHTQLSARAIILDPEIIFYDEPFTGQDPISVGVLIQLIKELNTALGLTSVIVSHDIQETTSIADMVAIIAAWYVSVNLLQVDSGSFWSNMQNVVHFRADLVNGLIKSVCFGIAVIWIAVHQGIESAPNTEGISRSTTNTVVFASIFVLGLDFSLTSFMFED